MAYSTIKQKKCKGNCGRYPTLGMNGYCYKCAPEEIKIKFSDKKKVAQRKANERTKVRSLNNLSVNKDLVNSKRELKEWFAYHMANSERKCENCGADLSSYNDNDWRSCQHHLIEKSKTNGCPSVASVLENHGVLCKWGKGDNGGCHSLWHTSNEVASKMPFFEIAKERFKKFEHLIIEEEKRKIPKIFIP